MQGISKKRKYELKTLGIKILIQSIGNVVRQRSRLGEYFERLYMPVLNFILKAFLAEKGHDKSCRAREKYSNKKDE